MDDCGQNDKRVVVRRILLISLSFVALNIVWRVVRFSLVFPLWGDEAFVAVNFLERDAAGMLRPLEYGQVAPIGFMTLVLLVTKVAGVGEMALRLVPWIAGILSPLLFWRLSRRILPIGAVWMAVAIFCASYYPVRHGVEIKPYSTDLLVSLVLMTAAWHCRLDTQRLKRVVVLCSVAAISIWFSYPSVFVCGAIGLLLGSDVIIARNRQSAIVFLIFSSSVLLSFGIMYGTVTQHHIWSPESLQEGTWSDAFPPVTKPFALMAWLVRMHTGNMMAYPLGGRDGGSIASFLLAVVGVVWIVRRRRWDLLTLLLGALPFMLIASVLKKYPYGTSARIAQHLAGPICILMGLGIYAIARRLRARSVPILTVGLVLFCMLVPLGGITSDWRFPQKKVADQRNRDVMQSLAEKTRAGDRWLVFNSLRRSRHGSDIRSFHGSGARFRYYAELFSPCELHWAMSPRKIEPIDGVTYLLVYHDNKVAVPQGKLARYLNRIRRQLGDASEERIVLTSKYDPVRSQVEAIEIYKFEGLENRSASTAQRRGVERRQ